MKKIVNWRKGHWTAQLGVLLIALALLVGVVGCGGDGGDTKYNLTMAASPAGGGTATDLTNASPYAAGTSVSIKAVAAAGYRFVSWTAPTGALGGATTLTTTFTMPPQAVTVMANFVQITPMVTVGYVHTVGLRSDGTVSTVGCNANGQCSISDWTDIVQISAGHHHTVGLKSDGTVVAMGAAGDGRCAVSGWTDMVQIDAGVHHTVGVKSDGTVRATGWNEYGQCDVAGWADIAQIAGGWQHTVGLEKNGTVVAVGDNTYGQCDVAGWAGITQIAAGGMHTVGLRSDGTAVAIGCNDNGQCDVAGWTGIIQVSAGFYQTVGLRSDGTVVAAGGQWDVSGWSDIVQVDQGMSHVAGLRSDGTVVAVGENGCGQCDVGGWNLRGSVPLYDLTMAVDPTGGGTATDLTNASPYAAGTSVGIEAVAAAGYRFVNWSAPAGAFANANSAQTTFTMPSQDAVITANFVAVYSLGMAVSPGGSGTSTDLTAASPYASGMVVTIKAVANLGYRFVNWSAQAGTFVNANSAQTTFTMPAQDVVITANFVAAYSLAMALSPGGSGTATDLTGAPPYAAGTVVSIRAVAATGYRFVNWSAPAGTFGSTTTATTTFTMPSQDVTVTANFVAAYSLAMAVSPGGSGTATDLTNASPYPAGTIVNIEAAAVAGYQFVDWTAPAGTFGDADAAQTGFTMPAQDVTVTANFDEITPMVVAGGNHTVGLKSDGTVIATGDNSWGQCNVGDWTNIVQVAAGGGHTVGVESDGTVVAVGDNQYGQCNVGDWTNVVQVTAGGGYTVGVESDGTVVAVGDNQYGQCNVGDWTNIVQVAAGYGHTVGSDYYGNAFGEGWNYYGQCDIGGWTNISQIAAGYGHTVGSDYYGNGFGGGWDYYGQCNNHWWDVTLVGTRDLIISSTAGGSVATPGEGTFTYDVLAVVNLAAEAEENYHFVNWTGDVDYIDNVNAASTIIYICGDYSITANFAPFAGGSGTEGDPYQIANWYQLDNVRNYLGSHFILINNLDSTTAHYTELASSTAHSGAGWQPIGTSDYRFAGTFDGQGHEIEDLYINRPYEDRVGLFCAVLAGGVLENINVLDADVTGSDGVGVLVGATAGTVSDSSSSGSVSGDYYVGGLVGYNNPGGYVSNSYSTSSVDGYQDVGGLVGHNSGDVDNSHADGGVFCSYQAGGGLVGYNDDGSSVDGSHSTGSITGYIYAGGLMGCNDYGDVSNSYADGDVTSSAYNIGGLVGYNYYGTVNNCHASGTVTGSSSSNAVGGLVGRNYHGTVSNSHADGDMTYGSGCVGGLVGDNYGGIVDNSYASGSVHGSDMGVGGLAGQNLGGSVSKSYASGDVTGDDWAVGGLVGSNDGHVTKSFSTGSVSGAGLGIGGLLGYNDDAVDNSYATGAVSGGSQVGGLVGRQDYGGTVNVCYSVGTVTGSSSVGGLVGNSYGTVTHSPWDTQTSGQATSAGGAPATTAQMQSRASYGSYWDMITVLNSSTRNTGYIWNIVEGLTYPFLSWQPV